MKKMLLITCLAGFGASAMAQDFVQPIPRGPQPRQPQTERISREGSLQRAARNGNVLQAINPFAPREFGSGAEYVENHLPHDPFISPREGLPPRPMGWRLLSISF